MFMQYLAGPGLVRLYWLEILTETVNAGRKLRERDERRPGRGRTLLAWILRGLGRRLSRLGEKLAPRPEPSASQFCG
jgi:hypothetical protein